MGEVRYNSLMKTLSSMTLLHFGKASEHALRSTSVMFPQEAEEPFVATERNAKLRYECEERASGSFDSEAENKEEALGDVNLHRHTKTTKAEACWWSRLSV